MSDKKNLVLLSTLNPPPSENKEGFIELTLAVRPIPTPKSNEVVIRVEAAPINPSDLGVLLGRADLGLGAVETSKDSSTELPITRVPVPAKVYPSLTGRLKQELPVGNEGAGVVVDAGEEAKHLLGKTVAFIGGGMYATYRVAPAAQVLELLPGTSPAQGAAAFVNPLTVLGMIETMKAEGYKGIVHTAAASQLGQMLVKACLKDDIPLVNIVRKKEQVDILKALGAKYVVNSSEPTFLADLEHAIVETGAYLAFDALGGGSLGNDILNCMEKAAVHGKPYNRFGSDIFKQLYVYGGLDTSPTIFNRAFGYRFGFSGWALMIFLSKVTPQRVQELRTRVTKEITTTFATNYDREISLIEVLNGEHIKKFASMSTGSKFLINPNKEHKEKDKEPKAEEKKETDEKKQLSTEPRLAESYRYDELPMSSDLPPHSSWGLWGRDDQIGTVNLLTPQRIIQAAKLVRKGEMYPLNWNMEYPYPALYGRGEHLIHKIIPSKYVKGVNDDTIEFNTQGSSQWDGLTHWPHKDHGYYNGVKGEQITGQEGTKNGIEHWARRGIAGRLVLIDYARYRKKKDAEGKTTEPYAPNQAYGITAKEMEEVAAAQGVKFEVGDILLLRTGWIEWYLQTSLEEKTAISPMGKLKHAGMAGTEETLEWIWNNHFSAVAADCPTFEAFPPPSGGAAAMIHHTIIGLWGMPLGELFDTEKLATSCATDGVYECFMSSAPLNKLGGVASPPNAIAFK